MDTLRYILLNHEINKNTFSCGDYSIDELVENSYFPTLLQQSYAFEVVSDDIVVGYFMIRFRAVDINDFPEDISGHFDDDFLRDNITALHIHFIAIQEEYQKHGIGTSVLRTIISNMVNLSKNWPIRVITLDATEDLVGWYKKEGFKCMENNRAGQDRITKAMFKDCHRFKQEVKVYEKHLLEDIMPL